MELTALIVVVGIALFFNYTNGFHDAANAIATSVSTRALTPRAALALRVPIEGGEPCPPVGASLRI